MSVKKSDIVYDELLNAESKIGRTLFGPIPTGHQREFFKHKENTWIWYESWPNNVGEIEDLTIRYEVRPAGVYKKKVGGSYEKITGKELENFVSAVKIYHQLVKRELYS